MNPAAPTESAAGKILLWGPSASGKTAFLAQLFLRSTAGDSDWNIFPSADSIPFIEEMCKSLIGSMAFPLGTSGRREINYRFVHSETGKEYSLSTWDQAGSRSEQLSPETLREFASAAAVILLFDLKRERKMDTEVLISLMKIHAERQGGAGGADTRPYAVCLAKADELIGGPADLQRARRDPDGFARELIAPDLLGFIEAYCSCLKFFPISSVGVQVDYGLVRSAIFYDEELKPRIAARNCEPINLIEPLEWIFSKLEQPNAH